MGRWKGDLQTFELLVGVAVVNAGELIRSLLVHLSSMTQDGGRASGMPREHACHVVYLAINHEPAVLFRAVLLNLLSGELLLRSARLLLDLRHLVLQGRLHPPTIATAWFGGVAEEDAGLAGLIVHANLPLDLVPAVVHHAHDIPRRLRRLRVLEDVEAAYNEILGL